MGGLGLTPWALRRLREATVPRRAAPPLASPNTLPISWDLILAHPAARRSPGERDATPHVRWRKKLQTILASGLHHESWGVSTLALGVVPTRRRAAPVHATW